MLYYKRIYNKLIYSKSICSVGCVMPSSPKISKEAILKAALKLLIENGYENLNIKALAKELKCSTQPISWHFGNMDGLRTALAEYALDHANKKMAPTIDNGFLGFMQVGEGFVDIAFDEPNLFRYLYLNGGSKYCFGGLENIASATDNKELVVGISEALKIPQEKAAQYLTNTIIYSTGITSLVVTGVMKCDKQTVKKMIYGAGAAFFIQAGAKPEQVKDLPNILLGDNGDTNKK